MGSNRRDLISALSLLAAALPGTGAPSIRHKTEFVGTGYKGFRGETPKVNRGRSQMRNKKNRRLHRKWR